MTDPRERIETGSLSCHVHDDPREPYAASEPFVWEVGSSSCRGESGYGQWLEVVEFARAILAADDEHRLAVTPTYEALREQYPDRLFQIGVEWSTDWLWRASISKPHGDGIQWPFQSHAAALEWLAAKLEELGDEHT